jgi:hypothetical protein
LWSLTFWQVRKNFDSESRVSKKYFTKQKNIFTKQMARREPSRPIFVARSASHFDCLFPAKRRSLAVCGRVQGSSRRSKRRRLYFAALYLYSRALLRSAPCPGS